MLHLAVLAQISVRLRCAEHKGRTNVMLLDNSTLRGMSNPPFLFRIQNSIQLVFNQQLSQWLIYGRLVDKYEEFFIVRQDANLTFMEQQNSKITTGSTTTMHSKEVANFSQYELSYEHLPQFIDRSTADDILFIGQTVIKFNSHDQDVDRAVFGNDEHLEVKMKSKLR